ncbi:MAG: hypothetical protein C4319_01895 [Acidimicrobiia bacterium]
MANRDLYAESNPRLVMAPVAFVVSVGILALFGASRVVYLGAMLGCYAMLFFGKLACRKARLFAGVSPTVPLSRLIKEGGSVFLVGPTIALLVLLFSRT